MYRYGVLQWRRPAPEDATAENYAVLCGPRRPRLPAIILTSLCYSFVLNFVSLYLFFQILRWFAQMCAAAQHIHDKRVLHRDLKSKVQ